MKNISLVVAVTGAMLALQGCSNSAGLQPGNSSSSLSSTAGPISSASSFSSAWSSSSVSTATSTSSSPSTGGVTQVKQTLTGDPAPISVDSTDELQSKVMEMFDKQAIEGLLANLEASGFNQEEAAVVFGALSQAGLAMGGYLANSVSPGSIDLPTGFSLETDITDVGFTGKNFKFAYAGIIAPEDCDWNVSDCEVDVGLNVEIDFPTQGPSGSTGNGASVLVLQGMTINISKMWAENDTVKFAVTPANSAVTGSLKATLGDDGSVVVLGQNLATNIKFTLQDKIAKIDVNGSLVGSFGGVSLDMDAEGAADLALTNADMTLEVTTEGLTGGPSSTSSVSSTASVSSTSSVTSSAPAHVGNADAGKAIMSGATCVGCHTEQADHSFAPVALDVNNFKYPSTTSYANTAAGLAEFISASMPSTKPETCEDECALDTAAYLWSLRSGTASSVATSSSSSSVATTPSSSSSSSVVTVPSSSSSWSSVTSSANSSAIPTTASLAASLTGDHPFNSPSMDDFSDDFIALFDKLAIDSFTDKLDASGFNSGEVSVVVGALGEVGLAMGAALANSVAPGALDAPTTFDITTVATDIGFTGKNFKFTYNGDVPSPGCDSNVSDCSVTVTMEMEFDFPTQGPSGSSAVDGTSTLVLQGMSVNIAALTLSNDSIVVEVAPTQGAISGSVKAVLSGPDAPVSETKVLAQNLATNLVVTIKDKSSDIDLYASLIGDIAGLDFTITEQVVGKITGADIKLEASADGITGSNSSTPPVSSTSSSVASVSSVNSTPSSVAVSSSSVSSVGSTSSVASTSSVPTSGAASISKALNGDNPLNAASTKDLGDSMLALFGKADIDAFMANLTNSGFNSAELTSVITALGDVGTAMGGVLANSVAPGSLPDNGVAVKTVITDVGFTGKNFVFTFDDNVGGVAVEVDVEIDFPTQGPSGSAAADASTLVLQGMSINITTLTATNGTVSVTVLPTDGAVSGSLKAVLGSGDREGEIDVSGIDLKTNLSLIIEDHSSDITVNAAVTGGVGSLQFKIAKDGSTTGYLNGASLKLDASADGVVNPGPGSSSSVSIPTSSSSVVSSTVSSTVSSVASSTVSSVASSTSSVPTGNGANSIAEALTGDDGFTADNTDALVAALMAKFNNNGEAITNFSKNLQTSGLDLIEAQLIGSSISKVGIAMGAFLANSVSPGAVPSNGIEVGAVVADVGFTGKNFKFTFNDKIDGVDVDLAVEFDFPVNGPSGSASANASVLILQGMSLNIQKLVAQTSRMVVTVDPVVGAVTGSLKATIGSDNSYDVAGQDLVTRLYVTVDDVANDITVIGALTGGFGSLTGSSTASGVITVAYTEATLAATANADGVAVVNPGPVSSSSSTVSSTSPTSSSSTGSNTSQPSGNGINSISETLVGSDAFAAPSLAELSKQFLDKFDAAQIQSYTQNMSAEGLNSAELTLVGSALGKVGTSVGAYIVNSVAPGSMPAGEVAVAVEVTEGFTSKTFDFTYNGSVDGVNVNLDVQFDFPTAGPSGSQSADKSTMILQNMFVNIRTLTASNSAVSVTVAPKQSAITGSIKVDLGKDSSYNVVAQALSADISAKVVDSTSGVEVEGAFGGVIAALSMFLSASGTVDVTLTDPDLWLNSSGNF